MADAITVKITGGKEIQRKLEKLRFETAKKIVRMSLKAGAIVIHEAMYTLAPRDTGFMIEHFGWRSSINRDFIAGSAFIGPQGKVYYPGKENSKGKLRRMAVATIARFLEFGTSRMAPRPFMTQAFESHKQTALERMIGAIKAALDEDMR
jgi:HK97 gp10 family phage protein